MENENYTIEHKGITQIPETNLNKASTGLCVRILAEYLKDSRFNVLANGFAAPLMMSQQKNGIQLIDMIAIEISGVIRGRKDKTLTQHLIGVIPVFDYEEYQEALVNEIAPIGGDEVTKEDVSPICLYFFHTEIDGDTFNTINSELVAMNHVSIEPQRAKAIEEAMSRLDISTSKMGSLQ